MLSVQTTPKETSEAIRILTELLQTAEALSIDGNPIVLCRQNLSAEEITEVRVVMSDTMYKKSADEEAVSANEYISHSLGNGFKLMAVTTVKVWTCNTATSHATMTVLAKMKA